MFWTKMFRLFLWIMYVFKTLEQLGTRNYKWRFDIVYNLCKFWIQNVLIPHILMIIPDQKAYIYIGNIRTVWHRKLYMKTWNIPGVEYFNTIGGWGGEGRGKCFNIIIMYTANIVIVKVQYLQITMYCIHNYKLNLNSGILLLKKGDLSISIKSLDCKTVGD